MKKIFFSALVIVSLVTSAFATDASKIDVRVHNHFSSNYNGAKSVNWTIKKTFVKADFELNGKKLCAYYEPSGELIGTSEIISINDLPVNAKRKFAKKYDGFIVKEAMKFESTDEIAYFISAENEKENVIVKVSDTGFVSVFKRS